MAQGYMDRGPYEIRTADQLVFKKRCLRSSLAGSPRRCRLRHCPTTSGVTPDEFVSAVDITGELCLRDYLRLSQRQAGHGTGSTARTIGSQQILC